MQALDINLLNKAIVDMLTRYLRTHNDNTIVEISRLTAVEFMGYEVDILSVSAQTIPNSYMLEGVIFKKLEYGRDIKSLFNLLGVRHSVSIKEADFYGGSILVESTLQTQELANDTKGAVSRAGFKADLVLTPQNLNNLIIKTVDVKTKEYTC